MLQRSGELVSELFEDELHASDTETSIELNFAVLKFKHVIKHGNEFKFRFIALDAGLSTPPHYRHARAEKTELDIKMMAITD